jgi:hypothetical protein
MSGNQLTNAGFADGVTAWDSALATVIDDSVFGYDGRYVLKGTKVFANAEVDAVGVEDIYGVEVEAGDILEVFAHHAFTRGTSYVAVNFYEEVGGDFVSSETIPVVKAGDGNPRLGLAKSYNFSHGRITVPATATRARLLVYGTASSGGSGSILLMKPYLEVLPSAKTPYRCWDPGVSVNVDLSLPIWPPELPHIRGDSFEVSPIPTRKAFAGDTGVSVMKKITNVPWYQVRGQVKVTQETQTILDKFFRDSSSYFWFVRPDTLQLCQATWLPDGEPTYGGAGTEKTASFALQLRVL